MDARLSADGHCSCHAGWRVGGGIGLSLASLLRFWAVAAEEELILGPARPAQAQSTELQNALEVGKQHLDLFAVASDIAGMSRSMLKS